MIIFLVWKTCSYRYIKTSQVHSQYITSSEVQVFILQSLSAVFRLTKLNKKNRYLHFYFSFLQYLLHFERINSCYYIVQCWTFTTISLDICCIWTNNAILFFCLINQPITWLTLHCALFLYNYTWSYLSNFRWFWVDTIFRRKMRIPCVSNKILYPWQHPVPMATECLCTLSVKE